MTKTLFTARRDGLSTRCNAVVRSCCVIGILGVAAGHLQGSARADIQDSLRVVAVTGQQAPGAAAGSVFVQFASPVLNNRGDTAFHAYAADPSGPTPLGIWSEASGQVQLVALNGPQPGGVAFSPGLSFAFNDLGETAFHGPDGIWLDRGGPLELAVGAGVTVLVDGQPTSLDRVSRPVMNRHGVISFSAMNGNSGGAFVGRNGSFQTMLDSRVRLPGPSVFPNINLQTPPVVSAEGHFASFVGGAINSSSIWTNARGPLELVADSSGYYGSGEFEQMYGPIISRSGSLAFYGQLAIGGGVTNQNDHGIWKFDASGLNAVVREGDPSLGLADGVTFGAFLGPTSGLRAVADDAGNVAFLAELRGSGIDASNRQTVWREQGAGLELVARAGSPAPGVNEDGVSFAYFTSPMMSRAGRIAFSAGLKGPAIYSTNDVGIWAEDVRGQLQLIIREGDVIDLDAGSGEDLRTIAELHLLDNTFGSARGESDQPYAFNRRGQIAFYAHFRDGIQAILVSNLVAVPEPGTITACLFGLVLALLRRCGRRSRA